ncbi:hypothetical protein [Bradyrhizobium sp. JYMT SZCCT0428]|uniref:hypothetical protein n=1 Tax=Bradyrhizobium sp. JYMT SZCCT0428 TaxID=2807673 RepID=UPI001BA74406|nr:hypothetical protein [Bradyrhizobium sp. JYMT SZCCT0428]MBR1157026.1 hypothetical protein [Bradyrhizobium sp. JYMT SZCCT0428]
MNNVVSFPGHSPPRGTPAIVQEVPLEKVQRTRQRVDEDIEAHIAARAAYAKAVAWEAAAESESLPSSRIEEARRRSAEAFEELRFRGRALLVVMPTDPKGLVDLLLYLEKHFSILPQEINGKSLALELVRTMRMSLRRIADYSKHGPTS